MNKKFISYTLLSSILLTSTNIADANNIKCERWMLTISTSAIINWQNIKECAIRNSSSYSYNESLDLNFEKDRWFRKEDRYRSYNPTFNCHSLSFNKRKFWLDDPINIFNKFVDNNLVWKLENAKRWDRWVMLQEHPNWKIKIWGKNYIIYHSYIFEENYKWNNTRIKSKYWIYWEYRHWLINVLNEYDKNRKLVHLILRYDNWNNFSYRSVEPIKIINNDDIKDLKIENIVNEQKISKNSNLNQYKNMSKTELLESIDILDLNPITYSWNKNIKYLESSLILLNDKMEYLFNNIKIDTEVVKFFENKIRKEKLEKDYSWNTFLKILKNNKR